MNANPSKTVSNEVSTEHLIELPAFHKCHGEMTIVTMVRTPAELKSTIEDSGLVKCESW